MPLPNWFYFDEDDWGEFTESEWLGFLEAAADGVTFVVEANGVFIPGAAAQDVYPVGVEV